MAILLTILSLAILILVHELGHFLAAKFFGMRVDEFGIGFPPRIFQKKVGETNYSVNALPLGGYVKIFGENGNEVALQDPRSFCSAPVWKRALVIVAGVFMNFFVGWLIVSSVFFVGTPLGIYIDSVLPETPAAAAGLQVGDIISGYESGQGFIDLINQNQGKEITLEVTRKAEKLYIPVTPRVIPEGGKGALGAVISESGTPPHPFFQSLWLGLKESVFIMGAVLSGLGKLFAAIFTQGKLLEGFVGPIGVFGIASQTAQLGFVYFLQLLGFITLNLTVLNILPFPALDGGRMFFVILEKIKGSRLTPRFEMLANAIGFSVLIALILAVTVRDVLNLF